MLGISQALDLDEEEIKKMEILKSWKSFLVEVTCKRPSTAGPAAAK